MKLTDNQKKALITAIMLVVPFGLSVALIYQTYKKVKDKPQFQKLLSYFKKQ